VYAPKPAPEIVSDDRPETGVFLGELEVTPMHDAVVSVPARQLDAPAIQKPLVHVGWQDAPLAILELHVPRAPAVGAETEQVLGEHKLVSDNTPLTHDRMPVSTYWFWYPE
jgi:hypothetical protein